MSTDLSLNNFAPEGCHEYLLDHAPRVLRFRAGGDFAAWREAVDSRLRELLGWEPERVEARLRVEYEREQETYFERRFVFTSEYLVDVPCHLLIPKEGKAPFPLMICLQGHSSGMHISLGKALYEGDEESIAGGRDFGLQAVREGYAALVLEQRCFGERKDQRPEAVRGLGQTCIHAAQVALLLGRTMISERAWDVSRAIDAVAAFAEVDLSRIGCMGNSGGGTITYYAACLDPRITLAMPSCSICTYRDSIGRIDHCTDNYIPGALQYFDMADLAGLIAPRPLIIVAGREDPIFPLHGVEEAFATMQAIYAAAGASDQCQLLIGDGGHRFYPENAWSVVRSLAW